MPFGSDTSTLKLRPPCPRARAGSSPAGGARGLGRASINDLIAVMRLTGRPRNQPAIGQWKIVLRLPRGLTVPDRPPRHDRR